MKILMSYVPVVEIMLAVVVFFILPFEKNEMTNHQAVVVVPTDVANLEEQMP